MEFVGDIIDYGWVDSENLLTKWAGDRYSWKKWLRISKRGSSSMSSSFVLLWLNSLSYSLSAIEVKAKLGHFWILYVLLL